MKSLYRKIPIVDSHAHLCFPSKIAYKWTRAMPSLLKELNEKTYLQLTGNLLIKSFIFVEMIAEDFQLESNIVRDLVDSKDSRVSGWVSYVPMDIEVDGLKEYLRNNSHPKLRGMRFMLKGRHDFLDDDFSLRLKILRDHGLFFDIGNYQEQLPSIEKFINFNPDVTFVLDHLGNPFETNGEHFDYWKVNMEKISKYENVYLKISPGYCFPRNHFDKSMPYIDFVLERFNTNKLLIGSDYGHGSENVSFFNWMELIYTAFEKNKITTEKAEDILSRNCERLFNLI